MVLVVVGKPPILTWRAVACFLAGWSFPLSSALFSLSLSISIFKMLLVVDLLVGDQWHVFWRRGHFLGATGDHSLPEKKMEGKGGGCLRVVGKKTEEYYQIFALAISSAVPTFHSVMVAEHHKMAKICTILIPKVHPKPALQ